jgi:hypothetical protein
MRAARRKYHGSTTGGIIEGCMAAASMAFYCSSDERRTRTPYLMHWSHKALLSLVKAGPVPSHLAFIMDGNRRWATGQGKRKTEGHSSGEIY